MYLIKNSIYNGIYKEEIREASWNLALENYLIHEKEGVLQDYILFYINEPSIIIGQHQNAYSETNYAEAIRQDVPIIRRYSGGGAVYHDRGVLNYAYIQRGDTSENPLDFFSLLIEVLEDLGLEEYEIVQGRQLFISGQKVLEQAIYTSPDAYMLHGSLYFDSDISKRVAVLDAKRFGAIGRGINSDRESMTNIKTYLDEEAQYLNTKNIREKIIDKLSKKINNPLKEYYLTPTEIERVEAITRETTANKEWNLFKSPRLEMKKSTTYESEKLNLSWVIEEGKIKKVNLESKEITEKDRQEIYKLLLDEIFNPEIITEKMKDIPSSIREKILKILF